MHHAGPPLPAILRMFNDRHEVQIVVLLAPGFHLGTLIQLALVTNPPVEVDGAIHLGIHQILQQGAGIGVAGAAGDQQYGAA